MRYKPFFALVLFTPSLLLAGQAPPRHLEEAVKLLRSVQPDDTSYRHKETVVKWEGSKGAAFSEAHTDCSGFINSLLHHSYPKYDSNAFKRWFGKTRPVADSYVETILAQRGFARITKVRDIIPGDLIAMKYPPGSGNTGHIVLVSGKPRPRPASAPVIAGTDQWEVPIIDSSSSGHGKTDSRRKADGGYRNGLGSGVMRLYSQKSGAVAGYSWSILSASEFYDREERPLVIGRLDPGFQP